MSRAWQVIVLVVGLLGFVSPVVAAPVAPPAQENDSTLTWSVRPTPSEAEPERPNFLFDVEPGATVHDSIRVRNFGAESLSLSIYASDALTTSSGALDLLPAGEQPTDVGAWIVLDSANIEVPPHDFVDVPFTMVIPANVESGDHTGGIVTSFRSPGSDDSGQAVVIDRRLGTRVQVRVGGALRPQLEVSNVGLSYRGTANPAGTGTLHVSYTVTNTGNIRLSADQFVEVTGRLGIPGREATLEPMPELLPGNSLRFSAEIPDVWATMRTSATVELRPIPTRATDVVGDDAPVASASASTWSVPWPQLAIVLMVLGVILWIRWTRSRRRRREAAAELQAAQTAALVQEAVETALAARSAESSHSH